VPSSVSKSNSNRQTIRRPTQGGATGNRRHYHGQLLDGVRIKVKQDLQPLKHNKNTWSFFDLLVAWPKDSPAMTLRNAAQG
jgi:hypothetical protein